MMKYKDYSISAVRFIAMCLIITCHIMQYYDSILAWWFNVGVQIFFFVSGYLYGMKDISNPIGWIGKQFKKILIPYYIFIIIVCFVYYFIGYSVSMIDFIKSLFCISTIKGIGHLWFVKYILFCYLITPYLYELKKWLLCKSLLKSSFYLFSIIFVYVVVSLPAYSINPIWISCYIIGFFYSTYSPMIKRKLMITLNSLIVFTGVIINIIRAFLKYFIADLGLSNSRFFVVFENISHLMLGFAIFILLYSALKNIKNNRVLSFSDKYSYHIYIVHQLFILSPLSLMSLTRYEILNLLITLVVIIISGFCLKVIEIKMTHVNS